MVGAGLAGLSAALTLAENRPDLRVAVLSKVHPVRSHSGAAQGGINAAVAVEDKWQDHYSQRAKKERYPARSVYKLQEIQKKHHLIKKGYKVNRPAAAERLSALTLSR